MTNLTEFRTQDFRITVISINTTQVSNRELATVDMTEPYKGPNPEQKSKIHITSAFLKLEGNEFVNKLQSYFETFYLINLLHAAFLISGVAKRLSSNPLADNKQSNIRRKIKSFIFNK